LAKEFAKNIPKPQPSKKASVFKENSTQNDETDQLKESADLDELER